ncbi:DNA/RNA non-specific endonuclease [Sphingobacterium sp. LRF_L2]|uniref:DNA/RNA non-specific endonuclease n=1 Tax=Sphingobacterium sp. LRF_L2 TaxID=3369421 RepID=UPI003F64008A
MSERKGFGVKKAVFLSTILLIVYSGCKQNNFLKEQEEAVYFTPTITGQITTKATGTSWDAGDQIGVYMLQSGKQLSSSNIVNNVANTTFTINGSVFQSSSPVYLQEEAVDFLAYYPYQENTNFTYAVNLSDQDDQAALDLMYAANAKNITKSTSAVPLVFERQLSRLAISLTLSNSEALQVSGLTPVLSSAHTQAEFDLAAGTLSNSTSEETNIKGKLTALTNAQALVEFTLLPGEELTGKTIQFQSSTGESYSWTIPTFSALEKGNRYTLDIKIDNGTATGGPSTTQPYLEIPKMENLSSDMQFVFKYLPGSDTKRNYAMLYDNALKMAYWVAYPLHSDYIGSSGRTDEWQYDPDISSAYQPALFSGFPASGYDRGHQIPSADRTSSKAANYTTFYFSNMTAQNSQLNQGIWASLESKIRTWTAQCDTMYVVTGAMPTSATSTTVSYTKDNNSNDVALPKYYFKALAMKKGTDYYTIAYKMDNANPGSGASYTSYQLTVSELESATGFTFFPDLTATQKGQINTTIWK